MENNVYRKIKKRKEMENIVYRKIKKRKTE